MALGDSMSRQVNKNISQVTEEYSYLFSPIKSKDGSFAKAISGSVCSKEEVFLLNYKTAKLGSGGSQNLRSVDGLLYSRLIPLSYKDKR